MPLTNKELLDLIVAMKASPVTDEFRLGGMLAIIMLPDATLEFIQHVYSAAKPSKVDDLLRQQSLYAARLGRALLRIRDELSPGTVALAEAAAAAFPPKQPPAG